MSSRVVQMAALHSTERHPFLAISDCFGQTPENFCGGTSFAIG
jgi:hypothetical protein